MFKCILPCVSFLPKPGILKGCARSGSQPFRIVTCQNTKDPPRRVIQWFTSTRWVHILLAEYSYEIRGWVSLRELSEVTTTSTDAQMPTWWQDNMLAFFFASIRELAEAHGLRPTTINPAARPDEILAERMYHHIFDQKPDLTTGPVLLLEILVVDPAHMNKGIGRELLRSACRLATHYNIWIVTLVPETARSLFESNDFQSMASMTVVWSDNYINATGESKYFTMAFDPSSCS